MKNPTQDLSSEARLNLQKSIANLHEVEAVIANAVSYMEEVINDETDERNASLRLVRNQAFTHSLQWRTKALLTLINQIEQSSRFVHEGIGLRADRTWVRRSSIGHITADDINHAEAELYCGDDNPTKTDNKGGNTK